MVTCYFDAAQHALAEDPPSDDERRENAVDAWLEGTLGQDVRTAIDRVNEGAPAHADGLARLAWKERLKPIEACEAAAQYAKEALARTREKHGAERACAMIVTFRDQDTDEPSDLLALALWLDSWERAGEEEVNRTFGDEGDRQTD